MYLKFMIFITIFGLFLSACAQQASSDGATIDNSGTEYPGVPGNSTPGSAEGAAIAGETNIPDAASEIPANIKWIEYKDPDLGFSLKYPDIYTILKEPLTFKDSVPNLIGRFRLLEPSLANSDFAEMEPPKFSIEIFSNSQAQPLSDWIKTNYSSGESINTEVDGLSCTKVTLKIQLAPNQFIVCNRNNMLYKFTPSGLLSKEILDSFKFGEK